MAEHEMAGELIVAKEDGVVTVTFNRPDKLNALNANMFARMRAAVEDIQADDEVRVVVITGAGRAFCAGADVGTRLTQMATKEGIQTARREIVKPVGYAHMLHSITKPMIAAVNGLAVGAGLSIALLCDLRIASDRASFGAVWVKRGLMPDAGATYLLPRLLRLDRALELMFTGEIVDAREAERLGLVTRVVPHDELASAARDLALKIAAGPPVAIELLKRAVYKGLEGSLDEQFDFERYAQSFCRQTEDFQEGLRAFQEKRPASFQGR